MSDGLDQYDVVEEMKQDSGGDASNAGADIEGACASGEFGRVEGTKGGGDCTELREDALEELTGC